MSHPTAIQHWHHGSHPCQENALQENNSRAHSTGPLGRVLADSVDNKVHSSQRCITHARGLLVYMYHHRNSKVADEDADDDTAFVRSGKAASGHTTRNVGVRYDDAKTCAQLLHDNPKRALSCCTPLISHHHPTSSEGISRTLPNLSA